MEALQECTERLLSLAQYDLPIPGFSLCDRIRMYQNEL